MPNTKLPLITEVLPAGASGGIQFASIIQKLFEAEQSENRSFIVRNFDDSSGDREGADVILEQNLQKILVQIKFYSSPLKSNHKGKIIADFKKSQHRLSQDCHWWLITPHDLNSKDALWFDANTNLYAQHKGNSYLEHLFFKHPHIGSNVYKTIDFKFFADQWKTPKNPYDFFNRILNPEENLLRLFLHAQPTYYDCNKVFKKNFANSMAIIYAEQLRESLNFHDRLKIDKKYSLVRITETPWIEFIKDGRDLAGGMKNLIGAIHDDVVFYTIRLTESEEKYGLRLSNWAFVDQRWVFFGKIWRYWEIFESMNSDKFINRLARYLKVFIKPDKKASKEDIIKFRIMINLIVEKLSR